MGKFIYKIGNDVMDREKGNDDTVSRICCGGGGELGRLFCACKVF